MNTATAEAEQNTMSTGRNHDISPRVFVDRYSALGFERCLRAGNDAFVHHRERIIVAPVRTEIGSTDRWHTIRRLEDTLELHRARRRGNRVLVALALILLTLFAALLWPVLAHAESRADVIDRTYTPEPSVLSSAPAATCSMGYALGARQTVVVQCTHRLRGAYTVERVRSGHDLVLISLGRTIARGDAVTVTLHNTTDAPATGTAYIEFW